MKTAIAIAIFAGLMLSIPCFASLPDGFVAGFAAGTTTDSVFQMSAKEVQFVPSFGKTISVHNPNVLIYSSVYGENGYDGNYSSVTGIYYTFFIYNPTRRQVAGLLSPSSTTPRMPKGYTLKRLVSFVVVNPDLTFLQFTQSGPEWSFLYRQSVTSKLSDRFIGVTPFVISGIASMVVSAHYGSNSAVYLSLTADDAGWEITSDSEFRIPLPFFYYKTVGAGPAEIYLYGFFLNL